MSSPLTPGFRERRVSVRRLIAAGSAIALAAALAGAIVELWRFGFTQSASAARLERQVRRDFDQMTTVLTQVAVGVAMDPEAARALSGGSDPARDLFKLLDRRLANVDDVPDSVAVTIYDRTGVALAWVGRPSDVGVPTRLNGPSAFFVTPSPLGLRLVHILPILASDQRRVGSVAAEHVLSPSPVAAPSPPAITSSRRHSVRPRCARAGREQATRLAPTRFCCTHRAANRCSRCRWTRRTLTRRGRPGVDR